MIAEPRSRARLAKSRHDAAYVVVSLEAAEVGSRPAFQPRSRASGAPETIKRIYKSIHMMAATISCFFPPFFPKPLVAKSESM